MARSAVSTAPSFKGFQLCRKKIGRCQNPDNLAVVKRIIFGMFIAVGILFIVKPDGWIICRHDVNDDTFDPEPADNARFYII